MKKFLYNIVLLFKYCLGHVKQYHTGETKNRIRILRELLFWIFHEGEFCKMYYAFGLNVKGSSSSNYMGRKSFMKVKNKVEAAMKEKAGCQALNFDVITKDKFYANSILQANGISCLKNLALVYRNQVIFANGGSGDLTSLMSYTSFILKNATLEAGDGILICYPDNGGIIIKNHPHSLDEFSKLLGNYVWVLQSLCRSSEAIRKVNSSALNTTRIVTIMNHTTPMYLTGFQGFAANNNTTDSWIHGSIYVGIDITKNALKEYGFYNLDSKEKSRTLNHPDSNIVFKDYALPQLKEAVQLCIDAHRLFYFNFIIGWDVAITDEGAFIVEANEKPGMNAVQCIDGGLRKTILKYANYHLANTLT